jgi:hypothetical protein
MQFRGKIVQGGQVLFHNVSGELDIVPPGPGLGSWSGEFVLPKGNFIPARTTARLVLDDGREGEFFIDGIQPGPASGSFLFHFQGSGPLQ